MERSELVVGAPIESPRGRLLVGFVSHGGKERRKRGEVTTDYTDFTDFLGVGCTASGVKICAPSGIAAHTKRTFSAVNAVFE
jgi:hypothetical protein